MRGRVALTYPVSPRLLRREWWLMWQTVFLFISILFTTGQDLSGGGVMPLAGNPFLIFKLFALLFPLFSVSVFLNASKFSSSLGFAIKDSRFLIGFFIVAFLSIPFAVAPFYSLQKLIIFLISFAALLAVMIQYRFGLPAERSFIAFSNHILWLYTILWGLLAVSISKFGVTSTFTDLRTCLVNLAIIHPNLLAGFTVIGMCLSLVARGSPQPLRVSAFSACVILILCTGSRAVFASVPVAILLTLVVMTARGRGRYVAALTISLLILSGLAALMLIMDAVPHTEVASRLSRTGDESEIYTMTGRTIVWQAVWEGLDLKAWLIGHGFAVMKPEISVDMGTGVIFGAHNTYLCILAGTGIIGLAMYVLQLLKMLGNAFRSQSYIFLFLMLQFLVNSIVSTRFGLNLNPSFAVLWLSLSLAPVSLYVKTPRKRHSAHRLPTPPRQGRRERYRVQSS